MVWGCACCLDITFALIFVSLPLCEHSDFSTSIYRQWAPCKRNYSYNFIPIFLNFAHVMMCMWFGYNRCINSCHFFSLCELCHFLTSDSLKVYRQWVPCEHNFSYNFIPIFLKLCICFLHSLEMCMWFGYNFWMYFLSLFPLCELCNFLTSDFMKVSGQWVPCERNF